MITSSPFRSARRRALIDGVLAAGGDDAFGRLVGRCRVPAACQLQTALRSGAMPAVAVYFVRFSSSAWMAACLM